MILYSTTGPTYLIVTFLDTVHNCLENGEIIYTKCPLLYWKKLLSLFIIAYLLDLKS